MLWIAPPLISVSRCSLGSLPRPKRGRQAAHAARSAWQHSCLFARGTRENPRDSRLRPTAGRTRIHLPHGSRLPGLPTAVPAAPGAGFLHHPRPQRLPLPPRRCPCGGQNYRPALRPDHSVAKFLYPQILSRAAASHSLPRRGEREELGVSDQQLPAAHADHRTTVPVPLASRAVLQVDQATSAHPEVLRPFAQRGEDATLDCHLRLRAGGDCSQAPGLATQPLPHDTNSQPHIVRKSAAFTGLFANTRRKRTRPLMQPAATVRLITGHLWSVVSGLLSVVSKEAGITIGAKSLWHRYLRINPWGSSSCGLEFANLLILRKIRGVPSPNLADRPRIRNSQSRRMTEGLQWRDGGLALSQRLVPQLPRRRDDVTHGRRAAAVPLLSVARGHHVPVGASGCVVGAVGAGTPLHAGD